MSPLSIIGEKQQPRRVFVQTPDGKQAGTRKLLGQQVDDRLCTGIFCRRQDTFWLIEHEIVKFFVRYSLSLDRYRITARLDLLAAVSAGHAIYGYGARPAQFLYFFSGSPSRMAQ